MPVDCKAKALKWADEKGITELRDFIAQAADDMALRKATRVENGLTANLFSAEDRLMYANRISLRAHEARQRLYTKHQLYTNIVDPEVSGSRADKFIQSLIGGRAQKGGMGFSRDVRAEGFGHSAQMLRIWNKGTREHRALIGTKDPVARKELFHNVYKVWGALDRGEGVPKGVPAEHVQIAKAGEQMFALRRAMEKVQNPKAMDMNEWRAPQKWNAEKVSLEEGEGTQFISFLRQHMWERSLPGKSDVEKLRIAAETFAKIRDGRYGMPSGPEPLNFKKFKDERVWVPNDDAAAAEQALRYGADTLDELVEGVARTAGQRLARYTRYTDEANVREVWDLLLKTSDPKDKAAFAKKGATIEAAIATVFGKVDAPSYSVAANIQQGLFDAIKPALLGKAAVRSFGDVWQAGFQQRMWNGKTVAQNAHEIAANLGKQAKNADARNEILLSAGIYTRNILNAMHSQEGPMTVVGAGRSAKFARGMRYYSNQVTPLNGLDWWTKVSKASFVETFFNEIADMSKLKWGQLPEFWQNGWKRQGIGELEWEVIRWGKESIGKDILEDIPKELHPLRNEWLTPSGVLKLSDVMVENYARKAGLWKGQQTPPKAELDRIRFDLSGRLAGAAEVHANYSVGTPNLAEKAFITGGKTINDKWGLAIRSIMQFRAASITQFNAMRIGWHSGLGPRGDLSGVAQLFMGKQFIYAIGETALALLAGKTIQAWWDPDFLFRTVMGANIMGPMVDALTVPFMRGNAGDWGRDVLSNIWGPTIGLAAKAGTTAVGYARAPFTRRQEFKGPNKSAINTLQQVIPMQNAPVVGAMMHYYMIDAAKNLADPRWGRNVERRIRKNWGLIDEDQSFFMWKPSNAGRTLNPLAR